MPTLTPSQAEEELIAHSRAMEIHTVKVIKALIDDKLSLHEVDFDALAESVKANKELFNDDVLAALNQKINAIKVTADTNTAGLEALKQSVTNQIAELSNQITTVQEEGRVARQSLDERISKNESDISNAAAATLLREAGQDQKLADHLARIDALESSKALIDSRVAQLEQDNTGNKSTIAQMLESLSTQKKAIEDEFSRAKGVEDQLRNELVIERERLDAEIARGDTFISREEMVASSKAASNAGIAALYSEAGLDLPADALIA